MELSIRLAKGSQWNNRILVPRRVFATLSLRRGARGLKPGLEVFHGRALWELLVMKSKISVVCVLAVALASLLGQAAVADLVTNGDFETPVFVGDYNASPSGTGWTFSVPDGNGEAAVLSSVAAGLWGCPGTGQCAVLYGTATIGQTITGFDAGNATFTFSAQKNSGVTDSTLTVTLDGTALKFGGVESAALNDSLLQYTTDAVAVSAGSTHTLVFQASKWAFLDNLTAAVTPIPEPSAITVLATGLFSLAAYAWRKQR